MKTLRNSLLIGFLLCVIVVNGQQKHPTKEKVDAMKIGFLTDRLSLSPEEAQTFWPVYNQYQAEMEKLRMSRRDDHQSAKENMDEMTDAAAEKFVDGEIAFRQNELDIMKKYHPQFKKVLTPKKVAKLYRAEDDFKRRLLEMIQNRQDGKKPGQGQGPGR